MVFIAFNMLGAFIYWLRGGAEGERDRRNTEIIRNFIKEDK